MIFQVNKSDFFIIMICKKMPLLCFSNLIFQLSSFGYDLRLNNLWRTFPLIAKIFLSKCFSFGNDQLLGSLDHTSSFLAKSRQILSNLIESQKILTNLVIHFLSNFVKSCHVSSNLGESCQNTINLVIYFKSFIFCHISSNLVWWEKMRNYEVAVWGAIIIKDAKSISKLPYLARPQMTVWAHPPNTSVNESLSNNPLSQTSTFSTITKMKK